MNYKLVFDCTGDEIPFDPLNQQLLDFYIDQLNGQKLNSFHCKNPQYGSRILDRTQKLKQCVSDINQWLYDLAELQIEVCDQEQYLDQRLLNKMHADWVSSQNLIYDIQKRRKETKFSDLSEKIHDMFPDDIQTPPLGVVISKLGFGELYNSLNDSHIHRLEFMFKKIEFAVSDTWTKISDNPFDKTLLTNDHANLSISFNHLGRTLYNKFIFFDNELEFNDENSFDELLGYVTLSLQPSQTIPLSAEYVAWCKKHNRQPSGDNLNIGNIPDLYDNLTKYRIIVFRNLLSNNKFSIQRG
jgi:hypothetical protein